MEFSPKENRVKLIKRLKIKRGLKLASLEGLNFTTLYSWENNINTSPQLHKNWNYEITHSLESIFVVINEKAEVIFLNEFAEKKYGFSIHDIKSKFFWEVFFEKEESEKVKSFFTSKTKKGPKTIKSSFKSVGGVSSQFLWKIKPLSNNKGSIHRIVCIAIDITEKNNKEMVIESLKEELRQKDLRLMEQDFELAKLKHELDRFVYSTSHDLRSPLTSLLGLFNIIKEEFKIQDLNTYLGLAEKNVYRLDNILRNILDYSKNNKVELQRQDIDFKQVLETVLLGINYSGEHVIEQRVFVNQNNAFYSDENRIEVILRNIISNAYRYFDASKRSFIEIKIDVESDHTKIIVSDNGIGIPENQFGKIFEMFVRASEKSDGAGLGLYMAKEIAQKLDGSVTVESMLKVGSSFTVVIPNMLPLISE